ncbi:GNAT family N-acetyltransferase [Piscibacillus salipiscarius]|uniref:GNAT family N-acetyltransferase n=2 Tax=Piscibacillus salipiscarius TaxID=299480 RepID=A0ABW5QB53_9BACI
MDKLKIVQVSKEFDEDAKAHILEGFLEHFGYIDHSLNPDLNSITDYYSRRGYIFLIGFIDQELVCTGAITKEGSHTGRIERMSVKKAFRRRGLANKMLQQLERYALDMKYTKLVLETNQHWQNAIQFYQSNHFIEEKRDQQRIHFAKRLIHVENDSL